MPNWKKVVISGSDALLNSIYVTSASRFESSVEFSGSIKDNSGSIGQAGWLLSSTGTGVEWVPEAGTWNGQYEGDAGISGSLTITGSSGEPGLLTLDELQFTGGTSPNAGILRWNDKNETLDLIQEGTALQLGQEQHWHVKNETGTAIPNGTAVMAQGTDGSSGHILVAPMVADGSVSAKYYLGVTTQEIPSGDYGKVTTFGKVNDLDTSILSEGSVLWLDPANPGRLTETQPEAPNLKIATAFVVSTHNNNGILAVRANQGINLHENHVVEIQDPDGLGNPQIDSQLLVWSAANSRWENSSNVSGLTASGSFTGSLEGIASTASYTPSAIVTASWDSGNTLKLVKGDGSEIDLELVGNFYTASWIDQNAVNITHNLGTNSLLVETWIQDGSSYEVFLPNSIKAVDQNRLELDFGGTNLTGFAVISAGGFTSNDANSGSIQTDTGSLYYSSSIAGTTLTFFHGDGTDESVEITNSVSSSIASTASLALTASYTPLALVTASWDSSINTLTLVKGDASEVNLELTMSGSSSDVSYTASGIRVRGWGNGAATALPSASVLLYKLLNSTDTDWYTEAGAVAGAFGSTAEILLSNNGTRTIFDPTTDIWLDGTQTTNQAPGGELTITSYSNTTSNFTELGSHFLDITGYADIAGYDQISLSAHNQDRLGIFGFNEGQDYLIRFWLEHDNITMSNNYTRLFGFTTTNIADTGTTSATVDPLFRPNGFFVGTNNAETTGRVVEDGTQIDTFTVPGAKRWNTPDDKMQCTVSAQYISAGRWVCRLYIDGVFLVVGTGINLGASNQHFQFGTGNSADDRDGNANFTHVQVDRYAAGAMSTDYTTNTSYTETDPVFAVTPTVAYAATYEATGYSQYKKIADSGANTASAWYQVI